MSLLRQYLAIITEGVSINDPVHMAAFAIAVSEAYDAAPIFVEAERKPWDLLNTHNRTVMFKRIAGSGVNVDYTADDPYGGPGGAAMMIRRMLWDMVVNKHLTIYSGTTSDHPVFSEDDNAVFRTIHDFYTHGTLRATLKKEAARLGIPMGAGKAPDDAALERLLPQVDLARHGNVGHNFRIRGELNAYSTHRKLAPPAAAPALFTEIVGQTCYYTCTQKFAPQKVAILRDFDFDRVGITHPGTLASRRMAEIGLAVGQGATTIETSIAAQPVIETAKLLRRIKR